MTSSVWLVVVKKRVQENASTGTVILSNDGNGFMKTSTELGKGLWTNSVTRIEPRTRIFPKYYRKSSISTEKFALVAVPNTSNYKTRFDNEYLYKVISQRALLIFRNYVGVSTNYRTVIDGIYNNETQNLVSSGSSIIFSNSIFDLSGINDSALISSKKVAPEPYAVNNYAHIFPYITADNGNIPIVNRASQYGCSILRNDGKNYLDPVYSQCARVCDYFNANLDSEILGLGRLVVNMYFGFIGESLRAYSIGSSEYWPRFISKKAFLSGSQLRHYNYNSVGLKTANTKFNDLSAFQNIENEFTYWNHEPNGLLQFRWNYWGLGTTTEYPYPKILEGKPLKAMDFGSKARNYPSFPPQENYNTVASWQPATTNTSTRNTENQYGTAPFYWINANKFSFRRGDEVQTLKILNAQNDRSITLQLVCLQETYVNNYAYTSRRSFNSHNFFIFSKTGSITLQPGEILDITIGVAPIYRNPKTTASSNYFFGQYQLNYKTLEDGDGQTLDFQICYLPEYSSLTDKCLPSLKFITTTGNKRQVLNDNIVYLIDGQNSYLEFDSSDKIKIEIEKLLGNDNELIIDSTAKKILPKLGSSQFTYATLRCSLESDPSIRKFFNFQILPKQPLISLDISSSPLSSFNIENNSFLFYFECENSSSISIRINLVIDSARKMVLEPESGYNNWISFDKLELSFSKVASQQILKVTKITTSLVDFFIPCKISSYLEEDILEEETTIYFSNYYPSHNNFSFVNGNYF